MPSVDVDQASSTSTHHAKDHLWAQRCKLYVYGRKAKQWVSIGTGKGCISATGPGGKAEFTFEDELIKVPLARHLVESASGLKSNAGSDKAWSWTARDAVQQAADGGEDTTWFTVKLATKAAAQQFYEAFTGSTPQEAGAAFEMSLAKPERPQRAAAEARPHSRDSSHRHGGGNMSDGRQLDGPTQQLATLPPADPDQH